MPAFPCDAWRRSAAAAELVTSSWTGWRRLRHCLRLIAVAGGP